MKSEAWSRYYDEGYNAYYLYNETTGESVWESDYNVDNTGTSVVRGEVELTELAAKEKNTSNEYTDQDSLLKRPTTFRSRDFPRDPPRTAEENNNYDLLCYSRFVFLNAILVEAPISVIEGFLRIGIIAILLVIKVGYYAYLRQPAGSVPCIISHFREILLTSAAMLTLLIPGTICLVYRHYSYEADWELRPLPTVLGYVDVRRFGTITFSSGSLAINSGANKPRNISSVVSESHPSTTNIVVTSCIGENNQDSWKGAMKWVPREIYYDICKFVHGDNSIQSLNIVL